MVTGRLEDPEIHYEDYDYSGPDPSTTLVRTLTVRSIIDV